VRSGPDRARRFDIADIVRAHRVQLESFVKLSPQQRRVLTDIAQCRTAMLGGHVDQCTACGYEHPAYNSCRNRHCPKCQALAQEKWIAERRAHMLDVLHFHVVFTAPAELRPLAAFAPRVIFDALFHCVQATLRGFARRRLGATLGATLVLHTWTRDLRFHPHIHAIVTGGGLSSDGRRWQSTKANFLFPVMAMSRVLRAKMLAALRHAHGRGAFQTFDDFRDPEGFDRLARRIATTSWNVYAKPSFDTGHDVLAYLGRYTHRVGIANSRLLAVSHDAVTFRTKGAGTATLPPIHFLRRFVRHVLPDGFHKIRHIGLYSAGASNRRELARRALHLPIPQRGVLSWRERLSLVTDRDLDRCPLCLSPLRSVAVVRSRAPPRKTA
jgi:hypothetical protein